ncbi:DUF6384 family protein [Aquamicrobium sp. LC103]|uniref:DUF6384 family protein n=1 Tax=Aquamicrobium sp. LC103 TaxID=1120658 RepID=UPI00063E90DE|nr:DUF6384 family protein [Aquamicrobium sp. LC103]TKT74879.1 hypothetical protein XW59_020575 [Aquamicrobium sp. LC103]
MADTQSAAPPPDVAGGEQPAPKLNDLMLAMDVVDTLRHQEGLVAKELAQEERDETLRKRLRGIYESQGIEVTDRILDEGIQALKESRFVYTPPRAGFGRTLANLWVRRGTVGVVAAVLLLLAAAGIGWQAWNWRAERQAAEAARIELTETLPRSLATSADAATREARDPEAQRLIEQLSGDGQAAIAAGNPTGAREAIAALGQLRERLLQEYTLRVVSRPGDDTGVYRIPDVNQSGRNYYVIVEAVAPDGKVLSLPVLNEETSRTETVTQWGVRVPETVYEAVRRDKLDDGIVENNRFGEKRRGMLDADYLMPVSGGAITKW